jgi:hypothetical protein
MARTPVHPFDPQRVCHIVAHVHVREQRIVLEHHGDVAAAGRHGRNVPLADVHRTAGGGLEAGDRPQQRRLAAAGGAE